MLKIKADESVHQEEADVRLKIARSVIDYIEGHLSFGVLTDQVLAQIKTRYEIRVARLMQKSGYNLNTQLDGEQVRQFLLIQHQLILLERKSVIGMRREGKINDEVLRRLEHELDLEESRVMLEMETSH